MIPTKIVRMENALCSHVHPIGWRLQFYQNYWSTFCSDRFVLQMLSGVKINFIDNKFPVQKLIPKQLKMTEQEMKVVDSQIEELLQMPKNQEWMDFTHFSCSQEIKWTSHDL